MHETEPLHGRPPPRHRVNLGRAMAATASGGHIVAGHVDGGHRGITRDDNAIWYTIAAGPEILRYVVEKGSITIDGISLTVAKVTASPLPSPPSPTPWPSPCWPTGRWETLST